MLHFCTLFDAQYLSRGLTLYESLRKHSSGFHLYVFAFDDRTEEVLRGLSLAHVTVVGLKEFEDAALLSVKPGRSKAEYCWTSTSSTIKYVLERFAVPSCTYLDADMEFYADPQVLVDEMGSASILLTEHRYLPRYDLSRLSGTYCVQFITFVNDERGLHALRWWRDRCIEWCYAREEDGKFGDQKYLDDWTTRFDGVHVLRHEGGGLAPWNISGYSVSAREGSVEVKNLRSGREWPAVFYHFHYVRFHPGGLVDLGDYRLGPDVIRALYEPYLRRLEEAKRRVGKLNPDLDPHGMRPLPEGLRAWEIRMKRRVKRQYNVRTLSELLAR